jgi:hypothetical protein
VSAPRTTTLRTLLRCGGALLVLTVATGWFAWSAFTHAHNTAETARDKTVPAIIEVSAARSALIQADQAAIQSFNTDAAQFGGPGEEYLAIATQNLTRAAEDNVTGGDGSQTLRSAQGQLASYLSLIEQAAAIYRQNKNAPLWVTDLWNASQLLHGEHGVLAELDTLQVAQRNRLDEELDSGAIFWSRLSWLVPAILLFGLLGMTQWYLTRRFRRVVNPGLLMAALCLLGLIGVTAVPTFNAYRHFASVRSAVPTAIDTPSERAAAFDKHGQQVLAELMRKRCADQCGYTVDAFLASHPDGDGSSATGIVQITGNTEHITRDITDNIENAGQYRNYWFLVPLGSVLVLGSIAAGLYFHIDKYRYRAR